MRAPLVASSSPRRDLRLGVISLCHHASLEPVGALLFTQVRQPPCRSRRPKSLLDYVPGVLVERKTYADFVMSLVDGRLFPQAAALARSPHCPVILLEGPKPSRMPDVHPHALKGAIVSLAVMWRLPVVHARDPEDALWVLRCLAHQVGRAEPGVLKRYDQKPKRLASKKIYVLQGLPGVGPALADRLLLHFGTVEQVITADEITLMQVPGLGRTKARRIREIVS
jgi:DNA excision repair protein ERCC-4